MRNALLLGLLLLSQIARSQTMLPAAEWCAQGKKFLTAAPPTFGPDTRSDSIDIRNTVLLLNITDFGAKEISGTAAIRFTARVDGISEIRLDLLNMTINQVSPIDSLTWAYDGSLLKINWDTPLNAGQEKQIQIDYHGKPVQDASGWGGFYWQGDYAYNLGVGFAADPHTYGRAWFPCFDNFVERSEYFFRITTPADKPAYCNGTLLSQGALPNGNIQRTWVLPNPIPSYLACVAVGPFTSFKREYTGETGPVPVDIAVAPADSNKLRASFEHLPDALAAFEHWYGPYRWNKIGYSIVPFDQGAMEHATNVAYMRNAVDGTLASETLMAHEFSHHWWGDLATCSTAEDMWLNEGWAVYSEHLFLEQVYGPARYQDVVRSNFLNVLENTHVKEGGYRAVSGLPHALTYGDHVYKKGAVIPHNLRGYMGDSLFRLGLRTALENTQFDDWSSAELRDQLSTATGIDLTDFFDDWVFQPGFSHFSIDSIRVLLSPVDAPTQIKVFVKQKLRGATHFYQNVPLEFTAVNVFGNRRYHTAVVSGENSTIEFTVPAWFGLNNVWLNTRQKLTFARAEQEVVAKTIGTINASPAKMTLNVKNLPYDTALIRIEHHYAMPDTAGTANPSGFHLSNRYWTVDALQPFEAEATLIYDGKGQADQLDAELFAQTGPKEDSIILAYRPGPGHPWKEHPNYSKNTIGSAQDRYGVLRPMSLPAGQYTIAKGVGTVAVQSLERAPLRISVTPNPASARIRIQSDEPMEQLQIFNLKGEMVFEKKAVQGKAVEVQTSSWPAGMYWALVTGGGRAGVAGPFSVVK